VNAQPEPLPTTEEIRAELRRVLESKPFAAAKRLSGFLEHVVLSAIEGSEVKEALIGVAVYGRDPAYDPKTDSIVRAEASRLRAKLRDYYDSEGKDNSVRIDLPKGGYQPVFRRLGPADPPEPAQRRSQWRLPAAAAIVLLTLAGAIWWGRIRLTKTHSIALAPLVASGSDGAVQTLAGSLTTEVRNALVASKQWKVAMASGSPSVAGRSDPGPMGVRSAEVVLTGNLQSGGKGMVQVDLQLVKAADGYLLWSATYRNRTAAMVESQKDVARQVVEEITHKFAGLPQPARSADYALARELMSSGSVQAVEQSIRLFEKAIQSDPGFSPAFAGLSNAHLQLADLSVQFDTPERVESARAAAQKAIALDEANAEAHVALGRIHLDRDWDFHKAVAELRRGVMLDPVSITPTVLYSRALTIAGDLSGAEEAVSAARARLPAIADLLFQEGCVYFLGHKFEKMETIGRELIPLTPNRTSGHWLAGIALEQRGKTEEAIAMFESGLRNAPKDDYRTLCALSHSYALAGERERALATMRRYLDPNAKSVTRYTLAYCAALTFTALRQHDEAFDWLEKARSVKDNSFPYFPYDPRFDALRKDPRYAGLAAALK